jgi:hypothetical protein
MSKSRIAKIATLVGGLLVAGAATAADDVQIEVELHWDREAGISKAVVKNGPGEILAELPWDGALPCSHSPDQEESEVPALVFGNLRDQLAASNHLDADAAYAFVRGLLGEHADTPLAQLGSRRASISYTELQVEEQCGTVIDVHGECTEPAPAQLTTTFCTASLCKVTRIRPLEP